MATITFKGNPLQTVGELPTVDSTAPAFTLVGTDMAEVASSDDGLSGKRLVLNIFPSLDTGTCAASVRTFNKLAAGLDNTRVLCISQDLPFAQARFCGAEGIDNVTAASAFRSTFGEDFGVKIADGRMAGLLARAVVVLDEDGKVVYTQLVDEVTEEPDYDSAVAALG
ncbi:thiol peroxidase [Ornithinimicrobium sp. Y1847]|uniref:thiol peroxidase n=1 Tax=unclassified Ornithinimicrobium TaxID=2615080 RepID=UPI003B685F0A